MNIQTDLSMPTDASLLRSLPLEPFDHPEAGDAWDRSPLTAASDAQLVAAVAAAITPPKADEPSSFVLHAPLELLTRAALLPHVAPAARPLARRRIASIGVRYAHAGAEVEAPRRDHASDAHALAALVDSLRNADPAGADAALCFLLPRVPLWRLRAALVDEVVPLLGAAAHAPILLAALPRVADRIADVGGLLRAPLRTLAAAAGERLTWHCGLAAPAPPLAPADAAEALFEVLTAPPHLQSEPSIAATLRAVERSGDAARLLAGPVYAMSPQAAERVLLRVAALSMLQDDPAHAPYGWTHCLTLPQALLANADVASDVQALVAVAATHVLGFRATQGAVALKAGALPAAAPGALTTALATHAALHPDAHLAKYTLACLDAAARDAEAAPLFLSAAAWLGAWWERKDSSQTPFNPEHLA